MRRFRSDSRTVAVAGKSGFSLIEVMVAMTILAVIVVMCAVVFQQSSLAWRRGTRSAEGNMTLRALIGVIQRELTQAVDAREFGFSNIFQSHQIGFAMIGAEVINVNQRAPLFIEYEYRSPGVIERTEHLIFYNANIGIWDKIEKPSTRLNSDMLLSGFSFDSYWSSGSDPEGLPEYVTIAASVSRKGDVSSLGSWSWGPDLADTDRDSDPPPRYRSW